MTQKGLSLVELLIAMSIATVVGTLLVVVIVNSSGLFYKESSKLNIGLNINDALSKVRGHMKEANAVASSYTAGSTTYTSAETQLVLKVPSLNSSSNIIPNTFDYFIYFLDTSKLRLVTYPDSQSSRKAQDQIFSTNVDRVIFKYFDLANPANEVAPQAAKKISISLTLKQGSSTNYETNTATSEANLRND